MIYIPEEMDINRFVDVVLPTKAQIFARTGQRAVTPAGCYTGDEGVKFNRLPTESAMDMIRAAESATDNE